MTEQFPSFLPPETPPQRGRTVVVTGATGGLGLATARGLAEAGAHVILAVRDPDRGARVAAGISAGTAVEVRRLDVASLSSINAFTDRLLGDGVALGALVNNAGTSVPRFTRSPDGAELTWATNTLGPAVLARRLLPALTGPDPRIVLVASNLSQRAKGVPDLALVDDAARYSAFRAYRDSKTAAAALAVSLGDRLAEEGSPVRSLIAHPGVADTAMGTQASTPLQRLAACGVSALLARRPEDAARSILWAATAPDAPGRAFLGPGLRRGDRRLHVVPVRGATADPAFRDAVAAMLARQSADAPAHGA